MRLPVLTLVALCACTTENSPEGGPDAPKDAPEVTTKTLSGHAAKGPFLVGTNLSLIQVDESLVQSGIDISATILSDDGSWDVSHEIENLDFALAEVSGFYFNEVTGQTSDAQLTLSSYLVLDDSDSYSINLLGHLIRPRVQVLVGNGSSLEDAITTARTEFATVFDLPTIASASGPSSFYGNGESTAELIVLSALFQAGRSTGELSELASRVAADFADGTIGEAALWVALEQTAWTLSPGELGSNMIAHYAQSGNAHDVPVLQTALSHWLNAHDPDGDCVGTYHEVQLGTQAQVADHPEACNGGSPSDTTDPVDPADTATDTGEYTQSISLACDLVDDEFTDFTTSCNIPFITPDMGCGALFTLLLTPTTETCLNALPPSEVGECMTSMMDEIECSLGYDFGGISTRMGNGDFSDCTTAARDCF